jgi:hypothetical protein
MERVRKLVMSRWKSGSVSGSRASPDVVARVDELPARHVEVAPAKPKTEPVDLFQEKAGLLGRIRDLERQLAASKEDIGILRKANEYAEKRNRQGGTQGDV